MAAIRRRGAFASVPVTPRMIRVHATVPGRRLLLLPVHRGESALNLGRLAPATQRVFDARDFLAVAQHHDRFEKRISFMPSPPGPLGPGNSRMIPSSVLTRASHAHGGFTSPTAQPKFSYSTLTVTGGSEGPRSQTIGQIRILPLTVSPPRDLGGFEAYHAPSRRLLLSCPPRVGLGRPVDHLQFSTLSKTDSYHD